MTAKGGAPTYSDDEGGGGSRATNRDERTSRKTGRKCSACSHGERDGIDEAILHGASYQAVADRFGLSKPAVARHVNAHLSPAAVALADSERAPDLVAKVERLLEDVESVLDAAKASGQGGAMLAAIREARPTIELLAKLTGHLRGEGTNVTINVATSEEWGRIRSALTAALDPYPAAAVAVSAALLAVEGGPAPARRPALSVASRDAARASVGGHGG